MKVEIERKYLVSDDRWRKHATTGSIFRQAYVTAARDRTLRIRTIDARRATFTVKIETGELQRDEFEYDLPYFEALELMKHRIGIVIEKTRYDVTHRGHVWEIDVYGGAHRGLVVAEIELKDASEEFSLPVWVGREITWEQSYSNRILAMTIERESVEENYLN
ncbi:CYTH domain-containing protein [Phyllobacterium sp. P5_D12]